MASISSTRLSVYAALAGNLLVALTKTAAAIGTGSSAMLSEAVHSFVDTGNELLLLHGMRRSLQQADPEHPLGYGRELYFWSFIVALMVFALGAGVSIYQGIVHVRQPQPITHPLVSYVVFGLCFVFEGASWLVSLHQFRAAKGPLGYYEAFRRSKDPPSFMVLFEDSAALVGIAIGVAGTYAATTLALPAADGIASILIGLLLAFVAALLARESKSLLIGERGDRRLHAAILRIAQEQGPIACVNGLLTVQLAPNQIVAALSLQFADDIRASEIEDLVLALERKIRQAYPEVIDLFVKPQTDDAYRESMRRRFGETLPVARHECDGRSIAASTLAVPPPFLTNHSRPPAIERFFMKLMAWLGSAKCVCATSAEPTVNSAMTAATQRVLNPNSRASPPPSSTRMTSGVTTPTRGMPIWAK
ncbi:MULTISPECIES: cation diffusion facilitator family transporter [unclassified Rhodanobacter]|uniref:cation diffusion facilitator family transporter n=1 Tax=unclassified Rhodanobacter TaxID=2621553 RepID=UPI000415411A